MPKEPWVEFRFYRWRETVRQHRLSISLEGAFWRFCHTSWAHDCQIPVDVKQAARLCEIHPNQLNALLKKGLIQITPSGSPHPPRMFSSVCDEVALIAREASARYALLSREGVKARKTKETDQQDGQPPNLTVQYSTKNPIQSNRGTNLLSTQEEFRPVVDRWPKIDGSAKAMKIYERMVTGGYDGKQIVANCLAHARQLEGEKREPGFWPALDRFLESGDWQNVKGAVNGTTDPELAEMERSAREDFERITKEFEEKNEQTH